MRALAGLGLALAATVQMAQAGVPAQISLAHPLGANDPDMAAAMTGLAQRAVDIDPETDPRKRLDNRVRLELAAGRFAEAAATSAQLDAMTIPRSGAPSASRLVNLRWTLYAQAKAVEAAHAASFTAAFTDQTRRTLMALDSRDAYALEYSFDTPLRFLEANFETALRRDAGATALPVAEAIMLVRAYETLQAYREFQPLADKLADEDDAGRYVVDKEVQVKTPDGAILCALLVRPRQATPLPALLNFTIYDDPAVKLDGDYVFDKPIEWSRLDSFRESTNVHPFSAPLPR